MVDPEHVHLDDSQRFSVHWGCWRAHHGGVHSTPHIAYTRAASLHRECVCEADVVRGSEKTLLLALPRAAPWRLSECRDWVEQTQEC